MGKGVLCPLPCLARRPSLEPVAGTETVHPRASTAVPSGTMDLQQAADRLRALHTAAAEPLVLPNAWDAASARAVVEAGFPAVATSSVAVAHALGYEDGERTPPDEMFAAVARISRAVDVPV